MNLTFQRETLTSALIAEMLPLLEAHWSEVAHFADIPLEVDEAAYLHGEASGQIRCFTAYQEVRMPGCFYPGETLVGYAVYLVRPNPHYKSSIQASQDVLYLHPSVRGNGSKFVAWCDDQLRSEGVQAVYHHVKVKHDFGKLLERQGYEKVDEIWAKRLDHPVSALDMLSEHGRAVQGLIHGAGSAADWGEQLEKSWETE